MSMDRFVIEAKWDIQKMRVALVLADDLSRAVDAVVDNTAGASPNWVRMVRALRAYQSAAQAPSDVTP